METQNLMRSAIWNGFTGIRKTCQERADSRFVGITLTQSDCRCSRFQMYIKASQIRLTLSSDPASVEARLVG